MQQKDRFNPATAAESIAESNHMDLPTPPPSKKPKLFAGYKSKMGVTPGTTESVADVLERYLSNELQQYENSLNCFESLYLQLYFRITSAEATLS